MSKNLKDRDIEIIVKAKYRFGARVGDIFTLSAEETSWVEEKIIRKYGRQAQVKSIKENMMICSLVISPNRTTLSLEKGEV